MNTNEIYEQYQQEFLDKCQEVENGYISYLDASVDFKQEADFLMQIANYRLDWMKENVDNITNEADNYGKDGYRGFLFTKQVRNTASYKHIPEWIDLEQKKKDIESKAKLAFKLVEKGGLNVDENGEEIPLPLFTTSSFIKIEKIK